MQRNFVGVTLLFFWVYCTAGCVVIPSLHHILKCWFWMLFFFAMHYTGSISELDKAMISPNWEMWISLLMELELMEFGSGSGRDFRKYQEANFSAHGLNLTPCVGVFVNCFLKNDQFYLKKCIFFSSVWGMWNSETIRSLSFVLGLYLSTPAFKTISSLLC